MPPPPPMLSTNRQVLHNPHKLPAAHSPHRREVSELPPPTTNSPIHNAILQTIKYLLIPLYYLFYWLYTLINLAAQLAIHL